MKMKATTSALDISLLSVSDMFHEKGVMDILICSFIEAYGLRTLFL